MAIWVTKRTLGQGPALEGAVDADPSVPPGLAAPLFSFARLSGGRGEWIKTDTGDTDWTRVDADYAVDDAVVFVPAYMFDGYDGTWTGDYSGANGNLILGRSPSSSIERCIYYGHLGWSRAGASVGLRVTDGQVHYVIASAAADDVYLQIVRQATPPTHGDSMAAPSVVSVTWDSDHDSAAKRGAIGSHTAEFEIDSPFWCSSEGLGLEFVVDGDGVSSSEVDLYGVWLAGKLAGL